MNVFFAQTFKRGIEVLAVLLILLAVAPLVLLAALCIWLEDRGPVFFTQQRAGRFGQPFDLLKLRSMRVDAPAPETVGQVLSGNALVTRTGLWIRRLKLDEIPQLWNVLRGEMSLVGPRPALVSDASRYDRVSRGRLVVPPGMTGWAQVNGNVQLSWDQRIALDLWYIRHWSLLLDLKILLRTFAVILYGERVHHNAVRAAEAERLNAAKQP